MLVCVRQGSVYCSLLFSRLIPDLVILCFLLLVRSVVDLHPGVMETKQEQQNAAPRRSRQGELARCQKNCLCLTFEVQLYFMERLSVK